MNKLPEDPEEKTGIAGHLQSIIDYMEIPATHYAIFVSISVILNVIIPLEFFPFFIRLYCGLIMLSVGMLIFYLSWRTIKKYAELSPLEIQPPLMVFEGLFKYSRNPVFIASLFAFISLFIFINNAWGIIITPLLILSMNKFVFPPREARMRMEHGAAFDDYKEKVSRWM